MTAAQHTHTLDLPLIDAIWLHRHLQDADLVILDATVIMPSPRFDGDYRLSSGLDGFLEEHIPHARFADLINQLADEDHRCSFTVPDVERLRAALEKLGIGSHSTVVAYDRADGLWAARLWALLDSFGIHTVVLDGGLRAWRASSYPTSYGAPAQATHQPLELHPHPEAWTSLREVKNVLRGAEDTLLVCALTQPVFDGQKTTRYARRGHIPGSLNVAARDLINQQTGCYRSRAELLQLTAPLRADSRHLILYCGGGISASVLKLALRTLGHNHASIYDGSLQEWAADPSLPLQCNDSLPASDEQEKTDVLA